MKIDWKKEIKLRKLRRPSMPKVFRFWTPKLRRRPPSSKRSRPTLGGPQLHAPKFLADLYSDLRDRHLLPLVALLIIAMIAAPILLSGKGRQEEQATITPAKAAGAEASDAGFTVVPAEPGLRDYKRRLGHRRALNPFRQPAEPKVATTGGTQGSGSSTSSGSTSAGASEPTGGDTTASSSSSSVATEPTKTIRVGNVTKEVPITAEENGPSESTHSESAPVDLTKTETTTVESTAGSEGRAGTVEAHESTTTSGTSSSEAVKSTEVTHEQVAPAQTTPRTGPAKTTANSAAQTDEGDVTHEVVGYTIDAEAGFSPHSSEKTELAPMTKLPNPQHPVVLYMGLSKDHKRALFLMTSQVTAYYGGHCALDKQACQLVEVKPGKGVTFAYGYGKSRYKVHLKKIVPTLRFSK